ncbi:MAG TPA: caspase family protein [Chitinophagaceae bacterium]|jgi:WD40 repeat protein|nr:caspase family protein [Chitinophagaceae bacterium]
MLILKRAILFIPSLLFVGLIYGQQPKLIVPIGHTDDILSVNFSQDSKYIVTTSKDKAVKVWEASSGKLLFNLEGIESSIDSANFSHDGKLLVTVSEVDTTIKSGISSFGQRNSIIKTWTLSTGKLFKTFELPDCHVRSISFSKDDRNIFVESDRGISLYKIDTLRPVYKLHEAFITISHNEKFILTTEHNYHDDSDTVKIRHASTGKLFKWFSFGKSAGNISLSRDDKYILINYFEDSKYYTRVYDVSSSSVRLLYSLPPLKHWEKPYVFSPQGNYILAVTGNVRIWNASDGKFLDSLEGNSYLISAKFSSDEKYIVTVDDSSAVKIWDASSGKLKYTVQDKNQSYDAYADEVNFSPDGKYIIETNRDYSRAMVWEAFTGNPIYNSEDDKRDELHKWGYVKVCVSCSPDGKYIAFAKFERGKMLNTKSGNFINLQAIAKSPYNSKFSPDGKYIVTIYSDSTANVWELKSGKLLFNIKHDIVIDANCSADGKLVTVSGRDSTVKVWDALNDGKLLYALKEHGAYHSANFSADGKKIVTSEDGKIKIWKAQTGEFIRDIPGLDSTEDSKNQIAGFSPGGELIVSSHTSRNRDATVWDIETGKSLRSIPNPDKINFFHWDFFPQRNMSFSVDGKYLAAELSQPLGRRSLDGIGIVNISTGDVKYLSYSSFWEGQGKILDVTFNSDGKHISAACSDGTVHTWDTSTGKKTTLDLHYSFNSAVFSPDGKYIVTSVSDKTSKIWEASTGKLLYTFIATDSTDYLVTDTTGRYDGTERARKALYYVCGNEIIELEQLKELSWEPNLISKVMGISQELISSKKLDDLDICGYPPLVEQQDMKDDRYHFTITPRRGGLGKIFLYVGGKQISVYQPTELEKNGSNYQLIVNRKDIKDYLIAGEENTITVKATTKSNEVFSKGQNVPVVEKRDSVLVNPNLYCISVGICKYKGEPLKLYFASQDAADFERAISASSRKLLNIDGKDHVTSYIFNTEPASPDHWPLKDNIRKAFEDIAKKATANDILLVFLSGHGVLENGEFYYLTQQASAFKLEGAEKEVAISSDELNEWMRKIKAQKQVLILDACHSGQALQSLIIRKEIPADQQRALEKLKDMTGTYMLSASASAQSAIEMGLYNRGVLTYSLLWGMKTGEGLKDKYIDIAKWFQFAADKSKELAKDVSHRLDPQISINGTFPIGIVYQELSDQIKLDTKIPQFKRSNFQNDDLFIDDLKIGQAFDHELNELSYRGKNRPVVFFADATEDAVYSINGRYKTKENHITGEARLFEGTRKEPIFRIPIDTTIDNMNAMVKEVIEKMIKKVN